MRMTRVYNYKIPLEQSVELIWFYETGTSVQDLAKRYKITITRTLRHLTNKDEIEIMAIHTGVQIDIPLSHLIHVFPRLATNITRRRQSAASSEDRAYGQPSVSNQAFTACQTLISLTSENNFDVNRTLAVWTLGRASKSTRCANSDRNPPQLTTNKPSIQAFRKTFSTLEIATFTYVSYHFRSAPSSSPLIAFFRKRQSASNCASK